MQDGPPVWTMGIATPATVTVPVRTAPVLSATVKVALLLPVPERGATSIQLASLDAVQAQPSRVVMAMVPVPPAPPN